MNRIKQLSSVVANQIAAGEVIERPASVVKELLENALDAKATAITVELSVAGFNQIKVIDNGVGIFAEDLPLAVAPHSTSKIKELNDLYSIQTMGFRGEALASIASISRFSIISKTVEQECGTALHINNEVITLTPCARAVGTTIDVRDIFYNAPVRKKFLKTELTEYKVIESCIKAFALGAPHLDITLIHNGKVQLKLAAAHDDFSIKQRITKLLGKQFAEFCHPIDKRAHTLQLSGWFTSPHYQRNQNNQIWMYVNGRMVRDKLLSHAVKIAYDNLLQPDRYPACLLYLTVPAEAVDVNVHPTKHEVRFQQPRDVHDFIRSALRQQLEGVETIITPMPVKSRHTNLTVYEPKSTYRTEQPLMAQPYIILNKPFALLFFDERVYLTNIVQLHQEILLFQLKKQRMPLASRPLLVPISIDLDPLLVHNLAKKIILLSEIGLDTILENNRLLIKTIPLALDELNIKQFFARFLERSNHDSTSSLLHLLVEEQSIDASQITAQQYLRYYDYFRSNQSESWVELTEPLCQSILNAKKVEKCHND